ncbi:MAG: GPP34 family phosphoprotein [Rhodoferax sp.]|nr:GPP34 family phosphoprotein [Rhodoferax sp.]
MITLTEELLLLTIEDDGKVSHTAGGSEFGTALLGAALIDLMQLERLDLDLQAIRRMSTQPTGQPHLDWVLERVAARGLGADVPTPMQWLGSLGQDCAALVRLTLDRLVQRGILTVQNKRVLWVANSRRYPIIQGQQLQEAKLRILSVLLGNETLPSPHDTALIGLARVGQVLEGFMSSAEIERLQDRLDAVGGYDLAVRCVESAIHNQQLNRAQALLFLY